MKNSIITTISAATLLIATQAISQGMGGAGGFQRPEFASLDTDSNGSLTEVEFSAMLPEGAAQQASTVFARFDGDSDGVVSAEEYANTPAGGGGAGGMGGGMGG